MHIDSAAVVSGPRAAECCPAVKGKSFAAFFRQAEARFGLPSGLVEAVARAESGLNPRAVSPAGALGLMQLTPGTARALGVTDPFDPVQNVEAGARYLRHLLDRFGGNLRLALAAYNAGPGAVRRHGGVPPYDETQAYIEKVLAVLSGKKAAGCQGEQLPHETPPCLDGTMGSLLGRETLGIEAPGENALEIPAVVLRAYLAALLLAVGLEVLTGTGDAERRA